MKDVTYEELHELIDELELLHCRNDEDSLSVFFPPDDDLEYEMDIRFEASNGSVRAWSFLPELCGELDEEAAFEFANWWNTYRSNPEVYLDEEDMIARTTVWVDEEISKEYIKRNAILFAITTTRAFFRALIHFVKTGEYNGDEKRGPNSAS